jgi:co-chaperonin GroES (HSP10)
MECIGKRYLIECDPLTTETKDGIILPFFGNSRDYTTYRGTIIGWGTGWTKKEQKELVPIGSKIILNYKEQNDKIRLFIGEKSYYICKAEDILATIIEEEDEDGN